MSAILIFRHIPTEGCYRRWPLCYGHLRSLSFVVTGDKTPCDARRSAKMHRFANPTRFLRLVAPLSPGLLDFASWRLPPVCILLSLHHRQIISKGDGTNYVCPCSSSLDGHVLPCCAGSSKRISTNLAASRGRHGGRATAPIGAAFTLLALATGSLWGKPMWGTCGSGTLG